MHEFSLRSGKIPTTLCWMIVIIWSRLASAQIESQKCEALVQLQNDLWLVQQDGNPLSRLTNDGMSKFASAISPDGTRIGYSWGSSGNNVRLVDNNGGYLGDIDFSVRDAITDLKWINANLLRAAEHVAPTYSKYYFVNVPTDSDFSRKLRQVAQAEGSNCTLSSIHRKVACVQGDTITINNKIIYYVPDKFTAKTVLQTLNIDLGAAIITATDPSFKLEVKEIYDKTVALKVTSPDGLWKLEYVRIGDTMPVTVVGYDSAGGRPSIYGFTPTIDNKKSGFVTVKVSKSTTGSFYFEGDIAWDLHGRHIAAVEANDAGQRSLLILDRHHSDDDNEHNEHDENTTSARVSVPIDGPIKSVEFISNTRIRVIGSTQVFEQEITAQGAVLTGIYSITPALPTKLTMNNGTMIVVVPVEGWVFCH